MFFRIFKILFIFGHKNTADKQPRLKLLFRGIKTKKDTTQIVSRKKQYSRKVTVKGLAKNTGDIPFSQLRSDIQF